MRKPNKAIAAITTLAIAASMAAPAFAASTQPGGSTSENITATYSASDPVYKVDIDYTNMALYYTEGAWNTSELTYKPGTWSAKPSVTVTNYSNAAVTASVTVDAAEDADGVTLAVEGESSANLKSAAIYSDPTSKGQPQKTTFNISVSGRPTVETWKSQTIGTVTVTIE